MIFLNLILAELRLGLKNYQVGEKWILNDYLYLCKGLCISNAIFKNKMNHIVPILGMRMDARLFGLFLKMVLCKSLPIFIQSDYPTTATITL
ncbi:hypothetical protein THERMOT_1749 [Bathymodiolus thermophilus thioautotrophic gill symbiont]|nr:hypothetical protein THERMOT_1749 [Bathymodiolus thermophilus thioautotrophic gill symbiont]